MPDLRYAHVGSTTYNLRDDRLDTTEDAGAKFVSRTSTHDGAATIETIYGNTLVWNQLCNGVNTVRPVEGLTKTVTESGGLSVHGTVTTTPDYNLLYIGANVTLKRDGTKYLFKASKDLGMALGVSGFGTNAANTRAFIWQNTAGGTWMGGLVAYVSEGDTVDFDDVHVSVYDLTLMFGAGNEPATVADFEALFPASYYAYDAGSLLPVNMEGVRSTAADSSWTQERAIDAATYFPTGMKSAGSVYDELTADKAIQRVGVADSNSPWIRGSATVNSHGIGYIYLEYNNGGGSSLVVGAQKTASNVPVSSDTFGNTTERCVANNQSTLFYRFPTSNPVTLANGIADMVANGVKLYYELPTPTETAISPALNLSYRVENGGTEEIMVDTSDPAPQTAPVPMDIAYGWLPALMGYVQG